jgi:excinuclease ABC subunit C
VNQIQINEFLSSLTTQAGVYRFYALDDSLLYIGKAKNLKNRVSSYFQNSRDKTQRISLMVSQIERIEYTVVKSDKEAILLEANLIHSLQPKYNIALKDDRSYIYIRRTSSSIPTFYLVRQRYDPLSKYFGPYTNKLDVIDTLRTLRTIFPYCQNQVNKNNKPCNYVSIKQCLGICCGRESITDYLSRIGQIENVLQGDAGLADQWINEKIKESVLKENYELAAFWRDRLQILRQTISNQKVVLPKPQDINLLSLVITSDSNGLQLGSITLQVIKDGKIVNVNNYLLSGSEECEDNGEDEINHIANQFLTRFLTNYQSLHAGNKNLSDNIPFLIEVFVQENI